MAKVWNRNHFIPWICDDDEQDFFAAIGDYRLRVEQKGKDQWWWNVSFQNQDIMTDHNNFATCRTNAILLAEGVYYGHKSACIEARLAISFLLENREKPTRNKKYDWLINKPPNDN